jgi:hypothetical protein
MRQPRTIKQLVERQNQILGYKYIITEDNPFDQEGNQQQPGTQPEPPQQPQEQLPPANEPQPEVSGNEISFDGEQPDGAKEVDVTDLVKGQEEVNKKVDSFTQQFTGLVDSLNTLQDKLSQIDNLVNKVNSLETNIKEMNPSQEEKLEMISLDSYPYNITLKDYWGDKTDKVTPVQTKTTAVDLEQTDEPQKTFQLTQDEIDDYNPKEIEKTFLPDEDDNRKNPLRF